MIKFCSRCCMSDQKPGVFLDENLLCNGCRASENKKKINWDERWKLLEEMADNIKKQNNQSYDCLVPVSGGKDSWYQAYLMSTKLGLKTLCCIIAPHLPTKEGIHNLNEMIKDLNVDTLKITVKPSTLKKIRAKNFFVQAEPNWAEHCYVFSGVVNTALLYDIPLIVWGEDVAVEFGGEQHSESTASALDINENDLAGGKSIYDWLDPSFSQRDIFFYLYPEKSRLENAGIKSIYLSHFIKWDGRKHYEFAKERGFRGREKGPLSGNYINFDNIDEKLCEINIWLKYIKHGYWRPTDQTCYDIWNDRLTREEAVKIVKEKQDEFPKEYFEDFLNFHNISREEFFENIEKHRNRDIWEKIDNEWRLKGELNINYSPDISDKK